MRNRLVYTINPNFRLRTNYLLVEWIMIDAFTLQMEISRHKPTSIYHKGRNLIICQKYGNSLHFIYAEIDKWENRLLQKWLKDKLKEYIIDRANKVLPQRMHELENLHRLHAKKIIVKKLRKCVLGQCYTTIRPLLYPQKSFFCRRKIWIA